MLQALRRNRFLLTLILALSLLIGAENEALKHQPPPQTGLHIEHPRRFWALNPGTRWDNQCEQSIYISSLGLRSEELTSPPADLTVLLLGDSCTFGAGVHAEDRLDRMLEKRLHDISGRSVRVVNGGCNGYSSYQGLDLLREIGWRIRADVVVVAYLYGDIDLDVEEDKNRLGGPLAGQVRTVLWRSPLYRWLRSSYRGEKDTHADGTRTSTHPRRTVRVSLDDYARNLREIAALARRQGARQVVFLRWPQPFVKFAEEIRPNEHHGVLAIVGKQEGLYVQGLSLWLNRPDRDAMFWDNVHFNAKGCRAFADDLAHIFVTQGWVTPR